MNGEKLGEIISATCVLCFAALTVFCVVECPFLFLRVIFGILAIVATICGIGMIKDVI